MIPVHEMFHSFQGEGVHIGKNAFFIRTFGCPLHCHFCDSAGTWHPDYVPKKVIRHNAAELVSRVKESGANICIITGGEPLIHDLTELTDRLRSNRINSHIETSGAFDVKGKAHFSWVTLSPKRDKLPTAPNLFLARELKLIIEAPEDIDFWIRTLHEIHPLSFYGKPVWLHPEWSQRENPKVLNAITQAVKSGFKDADFRAGWQLHRLYRADSLDSRTAKTVPLGGNPAKGY